MDSQTIEATAARWLVKRAAEGWGPADQQELETWLNESTLHRVAFIRLDSVWQRLGRMKALGAGVPKGVIPTADYWNGGAKVGNPTTAEEPVALRPRRLWYALAAGLVLGLVSGSWLYLSPGHGTRYATPIGGLETLTLADGSRVTLNTDTSLRVRLEPNRRQVELDSGEAYFVVAKDPSRPFTVTVGNQQIRDIGTEFAVRHDSGGVQVVVADGRVQFATRTLSAGDVARTERGTIVVSHPAAAELDQLLGWREGFLVFQNTPLAQAVAEFNRYNTRKIRIADPAIETIKISGRLRPTNTAGFLWLLQQGFRVTVEQQTEQILLKRGA